MTIRTSPIGFMLLHIGYVGVYAVVDLFTGPSEQLPGVSTCAFVVATQGFLTVGLLLKNQLALRLMRVGAIVSLLVLVFSFLHSVAMFDEGGLGKLFPVLMISGAIASNCCFIVVLGSSASQERCQQ